MAVDWELINELATKEFEARKKVEYMGMANVAGLSYEEQKRQSIEYAKTKAKHNQANDMLQKAMKGEKVVQE